MVKFVIIAACASLINLADAGAFLKALPSSREERMSEEDVQTSLLAEVEGTFGLGSASSRLTQLSNLLRPMYAALPKNEQGYLGHATVRYALHRLFVQRHGWFIKGLHDEGGHRNSTSSAGVLKEHVPAYIQDLFEQRLGGRGFGLHELAVVAATIEHLVHNEAIKKLGGAFKIHGYLPTSIMNENDVDDVLDTYMTAYILGEDISNITFDEAMELRQEMPELYLAWNDTRQFVRAVRRNTTDTESSAEQKTSGEFDFSLVARVAERVGEQFGSFQDTECRQIKASLLGLEERGGTGRVRLSDFYKPAIDGAWTFQESVDYLRQLGALDESDDQNPRVIVANYISSPSNCIASSSFYSICCMDECESLLGHLEHKFGAPEAQPNEIAALIAKLPSSSVTAPRKLSATLLSRLEEIAAGHGGSIQLHGRLFAQWMHHVYPRECPYPHLSGTTNPQTPDEWLESTGSDTTATEEEMLAHVERAGMENATRADEEEEDSALPWSPVEELIVIRSPPQNFAVQGVSAFATLHKALLFSAMVAIAYGLVHTSTAAQPSKAIDIEKLLV